MLRIGVVFLTYSTHILRSAVTALRTRSPMSCKRTLRQRNISSRLRQSQHKTSDTKPTTFTAVREGIYSESFPIFTVVPDPENPPDEVKVPHDGSGPGTTFAKIDDLGEAIANLVKEYLDAPGNFKYTNQVMLLSGLRV